MSWFNLDLGGYDIVVGISQKTINDQFKYLFRSKAIKKDIDFDIMSDGVMYGHFTASTNPPTVVIDTGETRRVLFIVHFTSGMLDTWEGFGPTAKTVTKTFSEGSLGFRVTLGQDDAHPDTVPQPVKDALAKLNLGAGMFSMRQLFMDLQNANLAELDPKYTTLPKELTGIVWFNLALQQMMADMHQSGGNILGYGLSVTNPNQVNYESPSLPPTDLSFSANVFAVGDTATRNSDLDTLNYLMMTGKRERPANTLPHGNFVDQPDSNGTMAVASARILDNFLIPKLASAVTVSISFNAAGERGVSYHTTVGQGDLLPAGPGQWSYSQSDGHVSASHEGAGNTFPSDLTWQSQNNCTVSVLAGTNIIQVTGYTMIYHQTQCWAGIKYHAMSEMVWWKSEVNWSVKIALDAIASSGALTATVTTHIPTPTTTQGGDFLGKLEHYVNPGVDKETAQVANTLQSIISGANITAAVTNALANQNRFIFPGGQEYSFKDAVFSNKCDLLSTITINFY